MGVKKNAKKSRKNEIIAKKHNNLKKNRKKAGKEVEIGKSQKKTKKCEKKRKMRKNAHGFTRRLEGRLSDY